MPFHPMESGIFYTISINLCCFNFFLCFFPPIFSKLRQRLEPVEPNSGGIPAWQQLHRRIPGRHPMLWLCRLCLSRPLWLRYAKQLLSGYLVSAGWNGKPIRGRTAHPKKYKQNGLGTPAVPRPALGILFNTARPIIPTPWCFFKQSPEVSRFMTAITTDSVR